MDLFDSVLIIIPYGRGFAKVFLMVFLTLLKSFDLAEHPYLPQIDGGLSTDFIA